MLRFCANLSLMFNEYAFPDRFAAAAQAGFVGVEYLFPYDYPAAELAELLQRNGLEQVLFNLPPGDWTAGERGLACLPERKAEFEHGLTLALSYAKALKCTRLHCMAGLRPTGTEEALLRRTYVENLRHAADEAASLGIKILIEPINSRIDMPGYWLDDIEKAFELLREIDRPNVDLQFDLYHAQIIAGDLSRTLERYFNRIGHIQIADNPGRHEPGTGEIHYPFLFQKLKALGYPHWIGCEYRPLGETEAGLGWLHEITK